MYTLRCTKPLLSRLAHLTPRGDGPPPASTTVLGDWYANRLNVGRHRLVLCTNERSLLTVVVPAKDLPGLPRRLVEAVAQLLRHIGVPPALVAREVREMQWVRFERTASRSVLGSMNDFALAADFCFRGPAPLVHLEEVARLLAETPCGPLGHARPRDRARDLLVGAA